MARVQIVFGKAEHGWLPMDMIADDKEFHFFISDVPNDFLSELVDAVEKFMDGQLGIALLHEEPRTKRFIFYQQADKTFFRLEHYDDFSVAYGRANLINETIKATEYFYWQDKPEIIAKLFWRGLKNLESRIAIDLTPEHWHWGFPHTAIRRLEAKLK